MEVKELGHLVLYVRDLERSRCFYGDLLGWREVARLKSERSDHGILFSSGRTHHELLLVEAGKDAAPIPAGKRVGLQHFGLKIGELPTGRHNDITDVVEVRVGQGFAENRRSTVGGHGDCSLGSR